MAWATVSKDRYEHRVCLRCGADLAGQPSRIANLFKQHDERCSTATPLERLQYRRSGRWPKKPTTTV